MQTGSKPYGSRGNGIEGVQALSVTGRIADAGVGVAMANGSDATRAAADFVTASNDKDGIAIFIEEHLL